MFFSETAVENKLKALTISKQSVQELSLWLIHHRRHHHVVVKLWRDELMMASETKKLALMYLASDIVQNGKCKGPEYTEEFALVLEEVFQHMTVECHTAKVIGGLQRMLDVWERGHFFTLDRVKTYKAIMNRAKIDEDQLNKKTSAKDTEKRDSKKLVAALFNLENAPSSDVALRQMVQLWPSEYYDINQLPDFKHKDHLTKFSKKVDNARRTIDGYNADLKNEVRSRDELDHLLSDYKALQEKLLAEAERKMAVFTEKRKKLKLAHEVVKEQHAKLPDVAPATQPLPLPVNLFRSSAEEEIKKRIASLPAATIKISLPTSIDHSDSSSDDN